MPATYTVPKTMAAEPTIYSDWNTYLRDNILYFKARTDTAPCRRILQADGYLRVASSVTETTVCTVSVPGGTLGTNNTLVLTLELWVINNKGTSGVIDVRAYYGATPVLNNFTSYKAYPTGAAVSTFSMITKISGYNATNVQKGVMQAALYDGPGTSPKSTQFQGPVALAIDSTAAQTAKITCQMDANSANFEFTCLYASIETWPIGTGA
jgi:hypothetical protein